MQLFNRKTGPRRAQKLTPVTFRDFGGGWDAVDDDVNMSMRYMPTLRNFHRTTSGSQELRHGTAFVADMADTISGNLIDVDYYSNRLVLVAANGEIGTIDDDGAKEAIWNATVASGLVGNPAGWGNDYDTVDFVAFRDQLIIHNGVDKPVTIDNTFDVHYLDDPSTGSNVNVPIGRFGAVAANFHCVAGIDGLPTTVYISSEGTAGVFPGDPAPNNSISIDVGAYAPEGADEIIGLAGFRSQLLIFFPGQTLIVTLGIFDADGTHTPQFPDSMPQFGLLSHRCVIPVHNDLIFADTDGVNSAKRNLFNNLIDSTPLSELIGPQYRKSMGALSVDEASRQVFAVHDHLRGEVLVFAPDRVFVYTFSEKLRYSAWSEFTGWTFTCGAQSFLGRVYLCEGTRVYQLGNKTFDGENFNADKLLDQDGVWTTATFYNEGAMIYDSITEEVYRAVSPHTSGTTMAADRSSGLWTLYEGIPIDFDFELPWLDGKEPMRLKHMRYVNVISKGTAHFDLSFYVDNLYKDVDGVIIHDPAIVLTLTGNDYRGAGFDINVGGARRSNDPRLWRFPAKFKSGKFRITGETTEPLTIIGLSFLHAKGAFKRG